VNDQAGQNTNVVLVHAAWADGSSWNKVIPPLQRLGLNVVSAQIPLTSLTDDVVAVKRVLGRVSGPLVLAAHSYGGAVITAAASGLSRVKALVFIAAIVPDEGETVGQLFHRAEHTLRRHSLFPMKMAFFGCRLRNSPMLSHRKLPPKRSPL
jgi:pimeloyl-ACP methyl ester carboxylesterase